MTTLRYTLPLKPDRVFACTVTETPETVFVHLSGDKPHLSEMPAVGLFLWPILRRYEQDERPMEIDGAHNPRGACRLSTIGREDGSLRVAITEVPRPRPNA